jgi:hypothetical protein
MVAPEVNTDTARRDWYRHAIESDADRRDRFARRLERIQHDVGVADDIDVIDQLLDTDDA